MWRSECLRLPTRDGVLLIVGLVYCKSVKIGGGPSVGGISRDLIGREVHGGAEWEVGAIG